MPIQLIDKIKQKNNGTFKLVDASDINWDIDVPSGSIPDDYVTSAKMNSAIADAVGKIDQLHREVLAEGSTLPDVGKADTIYMLPNTKAEDKNAYTEYLYVNGKWEMLGTSSTDLTNYPTTSAMNSAIDTAKSSAASTAQTKADSALSSAKAYTDQEKKKYLPLGGGTMTGKITGIVTPTNATDAVNKEYVDSVAAGVKPADMLTASDITAGTTKGTFKVKTNEIKIAGLNSAAYHSEDDFLSSSELIWNSIS